MRERPAPSEPRPLSWAAGDALVVVDVQNDFLPGGALAVPRGDEVIEPLNRCLAEAFARGLPLFATRDWHPADHCSFRAYGGPWPPHCVQGAAGADFAAGLRLPPPTVVISKGSARDRDAYSGFEGTDLDERLRAAGVRRVVVGGLATDYCVVQTVKDALARGYAVVLLTNAIRAVNVAPEDGRRAEEEMLRLGAVAARTR
jgi:nicotinamidase/pyrazinamidase